MIITRLVLLCTCRYTITYPCILFYILYQNRMKIMEDQLLRAENRGGNRLENPHCYNIRKMYHKCVTNYLELMIILRVRTHGAWML